MLALPLYRGCSAILSALCGSLFLNLHLELFRVRCESYCARVNYSTHGYTVPSLKNLLPKLGDGGTDL